MVTPSLAIMYATATATGENMTSMTMEVFQ